MVLLQKWPFVQHFFQAIFARKMSLTIFYNEKTPFQAIKTRRSKNRKINPWFQTENGHFSNILFQAIQARKMSFTIIYDKKANFQLIKTRSLKSRKINIFLKGDNPWFSSENGHFSNFFFRHYTLGKCLLRYSRTRKTPFQAIKTRSSKSRKIESFSKGDNPWFSSKNGHFTNFFFLGTIGQENVFYNILKRKNAFPGYKNKKSKMSRN